MNNKYLRELPAIVGDHGSAVYDVYSVLVGFNVVCPARQHAIKKLLCAGIRGKGDVLQDLIEALQAVERAIELEETKGSK
jgi:pyruvate/2-oxoglutarate/acetoin dehydrogenase E1 component